MIPIKSSKWETLQYWIFEREAIRLNKEAGQPKPWTEDKTLQNYKFCNVHRRHDAVSEWIQDNWIAPNLGHPNMVVAMAIARMVNWPDTLEAYGFPDHWGAVERQSFIELIAQRKKLKLKSWTGAYMITAEHDGTPKEESVAKSIDVIAQGNFPLETLQQTWEELQKAPRVGSFIAAQIVADLKYESLTAPDWRTFCAPGPGSTSGLNWLTDQPMSKVYSQKDFMSIINELRARHNNVLIPGQEGLMLLDAQDFQNCLCELYKYVRGYSRTKYNGAA